MVFNSLRASLTSSFIKWKIRRVTVLPPSSPTVWKSKNGLSLSKWKICFDTACQITVCGNVLIYGEWVIIERHECKLWVGIDRKLTRELLSRLSRLSSLNLTPDETPEMSFQADVSNLRKAITSFGTISTQVCESWCLFAHLRLGWCIDGYTF